VLLRVLLRDLLAKFKKKTKIKFGSRHTKMISLYSYVLREIEINFFSEVFVYILI
jgi:hypothetical protein